MKKFNQNSKKENDKELVAFDLIGDGTVIKGDVISKNDIRINGEVTGSVHAIGKVIVGRDGVINGNANAREVILEGKINGMVTAENHIHLVNSCDVNGYLVCESLKIDQGTTYNGNCKMHKPKSKIDFEEKTEVAEIE